MKFNLKLFSFILIGITTQSLAQTLPPNYSNKEARQALQNSSQIIQTEIELQRLRSLQRQEKLTTAPTTPNITPSEQCIAISGVYLEGITLLTSQDLEKLTALPKNCITTTDINRLVKEITQLYIDKGYITARVRFIAPDRSGELGLQIVEGFIEDIQGSNNTVNIHTLFPNLIGKPLNLKELEQGLDQANRLASNNVTMALLPGKKFAGTIIKLNNQKSSIWHPWIEIDNAGQKSTGQNVLRGSLGIDSPLGLSDYFNLNISSTLENPKLRYNRSYSALYSIPYGRWTWNIFGSQSKYFNLQQLTHSTINVSGNSAQLGSSIDYVFYRNQHQINTLSAQLNYKQSNNFINQEKIGVSSQKLTIAKLSYNMFRVLPKGIVNATIGVDRGLSLFGAETAGSYINPRFTKFYTNLYWLNLFNLGEQTYKFKAVLVAQYGRNNLPGVEWLGITDPNAVGDFRLNALSSSKGWYATSEIGKDFVYHNIQFSPFIRLGYGQVFQNKMPNGSKMNDALGITLGQSVKYNGLRLDLGMSKGWLLNSPSKYKEKFNLIAKLAYTFK